MKKIFNYGIPLAAAILLAGCGGSSSSSDTKEEKKETAQAFSSKAQWVVTPEAGQKACFDFDANKEVNCEGVEWDIQYKLSTAPRSSVKFYTNSGPLATGRGGALGGKTDGAFSYSWEQLATLKDVSKDPDGDPLLPPRFLSDSMDNAFASKNPFGGEVFEYYEQGIHSKYSVFLVTLGNGADYAANSDNTYAIQFSGYSGGATGNVSGHPKLRYVKLSDNTKEVKEAQVDASQGWAYLNLETGQTVAKTDKWHLGFNRYNVITNSGDSGTGSVGTFLAQKAAGFYGEDGQVNKEKLGDETTINAAKGLLTDNAGWATPSEASKWKKDSLASALSPAFKGSAQQGMDFGFYTYTGMNESHPAGKHKYVANPEKGVMLRSGDAKSYARVHLTNIAEGQYTFDFDVAPAKE